MMAMRGGFMEIFFVYGLVLLFFVFLAVFVVAVLSKHPYEEPSKAVQAHATSSGKDSKIAYGVLSLIFAGLLVITVLNERKHVRVGST
jgi:hypothetical protein